MGGSWGCFAEEQGVKQCQKLERQEGLSESRLGHQNETLSSLLAQVSPSLHLVLHFSLPLHLFRAQIFFVQELDSSLLLHCCFLAFGTLVSPWEQVFLFPWVSASVSLQLAPHFPLVKFFLPLG